MAIVEDAAKLASDVAATLQAYHDASTAALADLSAQRDAMKTLLASLPDTIAKLESQIAGYQGVVGTPAQ